MNDEVSMVYRIRYDEDRRKCTGYADFSSGDFHWTHVEEGLPSPMNEEDIEEAKERAWEALVQYVSIH